MTRIILSCLRNVPLSDGFLKILVISDKLIQFNGNSAPSLDIRLIRGFSSLVPAGIGQTLESVIFR